MPSSTFDRVVQLLSDASHSYNSKEKISCLTQVKELITNKEPSLLDNFLDEFMDFQHDRSPEVRQAVVEFIELACKLDQDNLPKGVERLVFIVTDENPNVLKRVIACMIKIYKQCLTQQARVKGINKQVTATYTTACKIKELILSMAAKSENSGVRTYIIKFIESVIILHSKRHPESEIPKSRENDISVDQIPVNHRTLKPGKMEEESRRLLAEVIRMAQGRVTSVNLQVIMGTLAGIGKLRPQFMTDVVQAFETMHVNLPPNLAVSQVTSVRKTLKNNLLQVLRHPASFDFQTQITTLLTDLGATESEVLKALPKVDEVTRKRKLEAQSAAAAASAKRAKGLAEEDYDEAATPFVSLGGSGPQEIPGSSTLDRTATDLIPKMTSANVTDLVLLSMVVLPDEMPAAFQNTYTPIAAAGTGAQIKHLARMLAAQLVASGLGNKNGGASISDQPALQDSVGATPMHISTVIGGTKEEPVGPNEEAQIPTLGDTFKLPSAPQPPPKSGRTKPFKLHHVTKSLPTEVMETLARSAFDRILYTTGLGNREDVILSRVQILASLTSHFGQQFFHTLFDFIQENVKQRYQLAIALLYHEFVKYHGFRLEDDKGRCSGSRLSAYDNILTGLLQRFIMLPGTKDQYFGRLILEAPLLTTNAFEALKGYCVKERTPGFGFRLLRDLIETRPLQKDEYLSVLLNFAAHDRNEVRTPALDVIKELFIDESERIEKAARDRLHLLLLPSPTKEVYPFRPPEEPLPTEWSEDAYKQCLHLFLGVLPLEPSLLHELSNVYVKTNSQAVKRIILRMLDAPVNGLGMGNPEVLRLVQQCPKGAETLIMRVIHILTDKSPPSVELVDHVKELYNKRVSDVRFLIPVLTGLTKSEVIAALPKMIQLNDKVVKQVFNRLLGLSAADPNYQSPLSAEDLLVALHTVEFRRSEDKTGSPVEFKHIIQATQLCFQERRVYTQEKLSIVLNQLVEHQPLPTLLMRSALQTLGMYPRLTGFVANILSRLVAKKVWTNAGLWEGFIKCAVKLKPQSFATLMQLPPEQLSSVFDRAPDLRQSMKRHVDNFPTNQRSKISKSILAVIETVPAKATPTPPPTAPKPAVDAENTEPGGGGGAEERVKKTDEKKLQKDKKRNRSGSEERMAEEHKKRNKLRLVVEREQRVDDVDMPTPTPTSPDVTSQEQS